MKRTQSKKSRAPPNIVTYFSSRNLVNGQVTNTAFCAICRYITARNNLIPAETTTKD